VAPTLFGDGERLEEDRDVDDRFRHDEEVFVPFRKSLGAETVERLDAALEEPTPETHVLLAGTAIRTSIRAANARDDRRARPERACVARDPAETLMAEDQHLGAVGCQPILAARDLRVGATQADADDIHEHLALGDMWLPYVAHGAGARATRDDRERTHGRSI